MIASTISEQFVPVDGSRNYAQEGDVRLLASGDAGAVAFGNTGESPTIAPRRTNVNSNMPQYAARRSISAVFMIV
jgi:hypothetical protein